MKILLATNNKHKIDEIKETINKLSNKKVEIVYPKLLNIDFEPKETGKTFEENSFIKASTFFYLTKIPTLSDDSGLEVEALNGLPGVNSARFSEPHNDIANRQKLLEIMKEKQNRNARFKTVLAYYNGKNVLYFNGICEGKIIAEERGSNGFGYDPIFIPNGYDKTFAEMTTIEKNSLSHRYLAVVEFCKSL